MAEAELARVREAEEARPHTPQPDGPPPDAVPAPLDLDAKERECLQASWNGDEAQALSIRREINAELLRRATAAAEQAVEIRVSATQAREVAEAIVTELPFLAENDGQNPAADDFRDFRDLYRARGMPMVQALRQAAAKVRQLYPTDASAAAGDATAADSPEEARRRQAVEKAGQASLQQPPPIAGMGNRAQQARMNVEKMSDDEFAQMPEAEKKRLRGD